MSVFQHSYIKRMVNGLPVCNHNLFTKDRRLVNITHPALCLRRTVPVNTGQVKWAQKLGLCIVA